jgi:putative glutamine amidotransferase
MSPRHRLKRIAITQRFDQVPGRDEWRDSLDAQWARLLESLSALPILLPSGIESVSYYLEALCIDGLLLSGGNDIGSAPPRDSLELRALEYAIANEIPVLGVCRGMQFLNHAAGGHFETVSGHVATRHQLTGDWVAVNQIGLVNSYHNLAITDASMAAVFSILARSDDGVIEAMQHVHYPWLGIMWHPERETPFASHDLKLIQQHFGL